MKLTASKQTNYIRVLRTIWLNEGISRVEIADLLGLDKSTITNIAGSLQKHGVITETSEGEAGPHGGRRPIKLMLNKNYCAAAGVEVQPDYCNLACVNLTGEILFSRRIDNKFDIDRLPEFLTALIEEIKAELKQDGILLAGAGLGLSGIVNPENGVILESIPLGVVKEYSLIEELTKSIDVPVFIENDGNCCCWGELVFNRTEELQDFIFCLIEFNQNGLALGMGLVVDGKVHYGRNYSAGEFRSVFADNGTKGQIAAGGSIQNFKEDPQLFTQVASELGRNLALLVNTLALSDCFIGGEIESEQLEILKSVLRKEMDLNWTYPGVSACRIRTSSLTEQAVAYGAASMIIDRLFRVPDHRGDVLKANKMIWRSI